MWASTNVVLIQVLFKSAQEDQDKGTVQVAKNSCQKTKKCGVCFQHGTIAVLCGRPGAACHYVATLTCSG